MRDVNEVCGIATTYNSSEGYDIEGNQLGALRLVFQWTESDISPILHFLLYIE